MRALLIIASLILSGFGAYYGQPYVHDNSDAILIIITVTTVFAGFLVAIIAVLGDPALIPDGSWRGAELRRDAVENKLLRHLWLFVFYLITIALLFIGVLINKAPDTTVSLAWKTWFERAYLFFGIASFLFTFGLPMALLKLQIARFDSEIERRRKRDGLKD